MKNLTFFDADCRIGSGPKIGIKPDAAALIADMDYYGIEKALVYHGNISMLGALKTNQDLAEMLQAEDPSGRLRGVWCILPQQCHELPEPDTFFSEMKKNRIVALTLSPFDHRYVPCRMTLGKIMDAAAERRIPILLQAFSGKWQELYNFLSEFPRNVYILISMPGKWGIDRQIRPLLENFPALSYSTAGYWVPGGLGDLAASYGAERILYGSGFPNYNQGCGMLQLKQSGLSSDEIAKIAGGNLEKMLKGVQL